MEVSPEGRKRLQKLMVIQGVSARTLADVAGWKSHSLLGRILRGEVKSIDADRAMKIAYHLGVGMDDLFMTRASTDRARSVTGQRKDAA